MVRYPPHPQVELKGLFNFTVLGSVGAQPRHAASRQPPAASRQCATVRRTHACTACVCRPVPKQRRQTPSKIQSARGLCTRPLAMPVGVPCVVQQYAPAQATACSLPSRYRRSPSCAKRRASSSLFPNRTNDPSGSASQPKRSRPLPQHRAALVTPSSGRMLASSHQLAPRLQGNGCARLSQQLFAQIPPLKARLKPAPRLLLLHSIASAPLTLFPILSFVRGVSSARASRIIQPPARWPCSHDGCRTRHSLSAPTPLQPC